MTGFGYSVLGFGSHPTRGPNPNLYNLASVKAIHQTNSNDAVGINFNAGAAESAWMTGFQIVGTDGYVSNRGNNNDFDSTDVLITKIAMSSTGNGAIVRQNATGLGINSCDGFALNSDATKILIADFHGGEIRSGTVAEDGSNSSLLNITLNGVARAAPGTGIRFARWNNDGSKYYTGRGTGNFSPAESEIYQYSAQTNYQTASDDALDKTLTLGWEAISDMIFNEDGTKMYLSQHTGFVYQYDLSTAYDIGSSLSANPVIFDLNGFQHNNANSSNSPWREKTSDSSTPWLSGISWNGDGSKLYAITLWGTTLQSAVTGTANPPSLLIPAEADGNDGSDGTTVVNGKNVPNRTNTMPIIEFRVE